MFPPFSLGGIVLKQSALCSPFSPQTSAGKAKAGSGVKATPPAAAKLASLSFHLLTSFIPGKTPLNQEKLHKV